MSMYDASRNAMSHLSSIPPGPGQQPSMGAGKQPMSAVHYGPAQDPSRACAVCVHADQQGGCELVAGVIRPNDTCDLFEPAQPAAAPAAPPAAPAAPAPPMGP